MGITITPATQRDDAPAIWEIFHAVVAHGDTYSYAPETSYEEFQQLWFAPNMRVFKALSTQDIVGTYYLRPNHPGLANHVANAGIMVAPHARRAGVGSSLCQHAFKTAKALGYQAIQGNLVVSTNIHAIALWKSLGFEIIDTSPKAYRHATLGLVDAHIMHRFL